MGSLFHALIARAMILSPAMVRWWRSSSELPSKVPETSLVGTLNSRAPVTITARRGPIGGDGLIAVGFIDAGGIDLGKVVVDGDLGRIEAGDTTDPTRGLKSLESHERCSFGSSSPLCHPCLCRVTLPFLDPRSAHHLN